MCESPYTLAFIPPCIDGRSAQINPGASLSRDYRRQRRAVKASRAPLSLLPVYHHLYDAKLLLLTVPACGLLWAKGGTLGRFVLLVNVVGFVFTGDVSWTIIFRLIERLRGMGMPGGTMRAMEVFPVPLMLLVMGIFYLWVYLSHRIKPASSSQE